MINQDWIEYSNIFLEGFEPTEEVKRAETKIGDRALTAVILFHFPRTYLDWLQKEVPALEGKKPIDCLANDSDKILLKSMLMKMH